MLQLKNLKLEKRVIQSPMVGCTDLPFRIIAREFGMELGFIEMISAEAFIRETKDTMILLKRIPTDRPLGIQLMGNKPDSLARAAEKIEAMGFDILDLNLGCPVPKITSKGSGSALMTKPAEARKIFEAIVRAVSKLPITVKVRTGFEDASGKEAITIAKIAEECGLAAVSVHGRTRAQRYVGPSDWSIIAKVKKEVRIPVIGNGDITSGESAQRMIRETGCDAVMVSRGALGNPWIYEDINQTLSGGARGKAPSFEECKKVLLRHFDLEIEIYGERFGLLQMKRVVCWFFDGINGVAQFRKKAVVCNKPEEMRTMIEMFGDKSSRQKPAQISKP